MDRISPVTPCFTPGTMIETDHGPQPVETLRRGNRVVTRDNGMQRIEWVGKRAFGYAEISDEDELQPIHIAKDAFGDGCPNRDLLVSPAHRFLLSADQAIFNIPGEEALTAARHIVDNHRVRPASVLGVSYIHFLCEQHEVVMADGLWTESFHPDDQIMRSLGNSQRRELLEIFPEIESIGAGVQFPAARPIVDAPDFSEFL